MRLLWVATKPPWPPTDGGRRALALTLQALQAAGHELTLVAPDLGLRADSDGSCAARLVPARPRSWLAGLVKAYASGRPLSVARHSLPAVQAAVRAALDERATDVVVAEQLQALPQCEPAFARGLPLVLRAQNVESDLWSRSARGGWQAWLRLEARRLRAFEASALRRVAATFALSAQDAARLRELAGGTARIEAVAVPHPAELPAAEQRLPGTPPLVILAGPGWPPNAEGARWFVESLWPQVRAAHPEARLHVFGAAPDAAGVSVHAPPADSRSAFAPGSVQVVPLRVASGVRMKVLEAWARGVPVVATAAAASGLDARPGEELLLAEDGPGFAAALARLRDEPDLVARLVAAGRAALRARHDPNRVAQRWTELLAAVGGRR